VEINDDDDMADQLEAEIKNQNELKKRETNNKNFFPFYEILNIATPALSKIKLEINNFKLQKNAVVSHENYRIFSDNFFIFEANLESENSCFKTGELFSSVNSYFFYYPCLNSIQTSNYFHRPFRKGEDIKLASSPKYISENLVDNIEKENTDVENNDDPSESISNLSDKISINNSIKISKSVALHLKDFYDSYMLPRFLIIHQNNYFASGKSTNTYFFIDSSRFNSLGVHKKLYLGDNPFVEIKAFDQQKNPVPSDSQILPKTCELGLCISGNIKNNAINLKSSTIRVDLNLTFIINSELFLKWKSTGSFPSAVDFITRNWMSFIGISFEDYGNRFR
jgi:hypothetical protein